MLYSKKRKIEDLLWAEESLDEPFPTRRGSTQAQKLGFAFEKKVEKALAKAKLNFSANPWFHFEDLNGIGYCQPDFLIFDATEVIILEAKLRYTPAAEEELRYLYSPIIQEVYAPSSIHTINVFGAFTRQFSPTIQIAADLGEVLDKRLNYWNLI